MGVASNACLLLAVGVALSHGQPVQDLPVLKELPAEIFFKSIPGSHQNLLIIKCATVEPNHKLNYSWTKDGQPLNIKDSDDIAAVPGEGTLIFRDPQPDNQGQYQCFAQSEEGTASSRVVKVKMIYAEIPKYKLQKHKPVEGRPFKMDCAVPNAYPKPKFNWKRQDKEGKLLEIKEKRLLESPQGTLFFSNVTKEDVDPELKYVCVVESPAVPENTIAAEHIIDDMTLTKEPKSGELIPQYLSESFSAKVGDPVLIYCIYGGSPLAHPDWFKEEGTSKTNVNGDDDPDSQRVTRHNRSAGRRLLIKQLQLGDQGTYTCVADNGVGAAKSHSIQLTVEKIAEFVQKPEPVMLAKEGQDVTIPCQISGIEASDLTWTFNGKPLNKSDRIATEPKSNDKAVVGDLTIKKVEKKDNGYYGCKGANKNGDVYAETLVHVA